MLGFRRKRTNLHEKYDHPGTQRANRVRLYQALGGGFGDAPEVAAHRTAGTD